MAKVTIIIGALLVILGVGAYAAAVEKSVTALIPAFVGLPILVLGVVALKEAYLKHAMHAAAAIGLLGFLAAGGRLVQTLLGDETIEYDLKFWAILLMTLLTGLFVALSIKSFIDARRRRQAGTPPASP